MSWLRHPRFVPVRDEVLTSLIAKELKFRKVKRTAFLCGGRGSVPRDRVAAYLRRQRDDFAVFYAESVWNTIAGAGGSNALKVEDELARLADVVIIIVESHGTFAELGAFSLNDHLRRKLLPILPLQHKAESSFITSGPRKLDRRRVAVCAIHMAQSPNYSRRGK